MGKNTGAASYTVDLGIVIDDLAWKKKKKTK